TQPYALEREFEDVEAIANCIGRPVNVLGHSLGAICVLEAARRIRELHQLILYEPPIPVEGMTAHPEGIIERLEALLAAGDREGVLTTFVQEVIQMPAQDFEIFRASPTWASRVAAAHTLPRELKAQMHYRFNAERFKSFTIPTLLLVGEQS